MITLLPEYTYRMRQAGIKGEIFYENLLAEDAHVSTYFPRTNKESDAAYRMRPKIALPIAGAAIDRLVGLLFKGLAIKIDDKKHKELWEKVESTLEDPAGFIRNILSYMLAGGNIEIAIVEEDPVEKLMTLQAWQAPFVFKGRGSMGYEFYMDDAGEIKPIVLGEDQSTKIQKTQKRVTYTKDLITKSFGQKSVDDEVIPNPFGFIPAVFFFAPDKKLSSVYASPYPLRFNTHKLIIEQNHTFSQSQKAIKILQNVWKSNLEFAGNKDLRLDPDMINYLGEDGILEQVVRELKLEPEWGQMERIDQNISQGYQVPTFFFSQKSFGNLPSGVALEIEFEPTEEMAARIRGSFRNNLKDTVVKSIKAQSTIESGEMFAGEDPVVEIIMNDSVTPRDNDKELKQLEVSEEKGWITQREAAQKARVIQGFPPLPEKEGDQE